MSNSKSATRMLAVAGAMTVSVLATRAQAVVVASEDFDGGAVNRVGGFTTADNLDGGPGDFFGISPLGAASVTATWAQGQPTPGVPFSLADDSVIGVGNGSRSTADAVPEDSEAVFGQNRAVANSFFAVSDTRDFDGPNNDTPPTASFTFNVAGFQNLSLRVDMGAMANDSFGGFSAASALSFTASIDGGPAQTAFNIVPNAAVGAGYTYRAFDDGDTFASGANGPLSATGDNAVLKLLAETGVADTDTILDKSPASGSGAGELDTFVTNLLGTGDTLTLTFSANLPFEAYAFDNIVIEGSAIPEPTGFALLGLAGAGILRRRR